jgi:hypothetical protein
MILGELVVLLSLTAFAFAWRAGLVHEIVARRAVMTPVLTMELLLSRPQPHSGVFSLEFAGRYRVTVDLELKNGPQAVPAPSGKFSLQGSAEIADVSERSRLKKRVSITLDGDEVRATLFEFNTKEVKTGEKRLVLMLTPSPGFSEHYANATLRIQRVPRLALTF